MSNNPDRRQQAVDKLAMWKAGYTDAEWREKPTSVKEGYRQDAESFLVEADPSGQPWVAILDSGQGMIVPPDGTKPEVAASFIKGQGFRRVILPEPPAQVSGKERFDDTRRIADNQGRLEQVASVVEGFLD